MSEVASGKDNGKNLEEAICSYLHPSFASFDLCCFWVIM